MGPLGVVLAGGESRRYGEPKALVPVCGVRIIDRVIAALREVTDEVILSANEPELFEDLRLPAYPDERPELGPLAGIQTALLRARDADRPGILAVACDMPFPCVPLMERLRDEAFGRAEDGRPPRSAEQPDVVLPESGGRRGVEPLFGAYGIRCIPAIEAALDAGDRRMIGFHAHVRVRAIALAEVENLCDPERAFLNVNTPEDRDRAEAMAENDR